jgi:hypothetical protein
MERCNRPAWRYYKSSGYVVCIDHAHVNDPQEVLSETQVGYCDYPIDGYGAMRYDTRMRAAQNRITRIPVKRPKLSS